MSGNGAADPKPAAVGGGMSRRSWLRMAPLVPLAVGQAGRAVAEALTQQMSIASLANLADTAGAGTAAGMPGGVYFGTEVSKKLLMLHKLGILPTWFKREMAREARYNMTGIEPDIAGLASVSLTHKCKMQLDRVVDRKMEQLEYGLLDDIVRQAFYDEVNK